MRFYQLAFRYLTRKKGKSMLLFLVFLIVNSLILSASMILHGTEASREALREKTGSKVIIEIRNRKDKLTDKDLQKICSGQESAFMNRFASGTALPVGFLVMTGSDSAEEANQKAAVLSYDDLQRDSPFSEDQYRLVEGKMPGSDTGKGAVIHSSLAKMNGLSIGDLITMRSDTGAEAAVPITGLFLSGNEEKQTDGTNAVNRIENQIFIDHDSCRSLISGGYDKAVVYLKNPEGLDSLKSRAETVLKEKAVITTSDMLYQQVEAPLSQAARIVKMILLFSFAAGMVVVSLLLCMWMRARKKEAAIFISMGRKKSGIFLQALLESLAVFAAAAAGACCVGTFAAGKLTGLLVNAPESDMSLKIALKASDVATLAVLGGLIVAAAVTCAMVPVLFSSPRDTLAKMEG